MDSSTRSVSVVIPVHNARYTIRACLEAVLAQDYPAEYLETLVVDNNSSDGTPDIVRQYPVTLLYERDIQSSYAARNLGISHARGEIVAFTDADCTATPLWIGHLVAALAQPDVLAAGGPVADMPATTGLARFMAEELPVRNYQRLGGDHYVALVGGNAAYLRWVLQQAGGFDERMSTGGDIDLAWRVQRTGLGTVVFVPEAVVLHDHRPTFPGVFRRYRRYGYCSAMMTALHLDDEAYPQKPGWQQRQALRQVRALLTYIASLLYRNTVGLVQGRPPYERKKPGYWLVAEGGNLVGRLGGMWETRLFRCPPRAFQEEDG